MHRRIPLATLACLSMFTLAACGGGEADPAAFPDDDITFVVPFSAGGPTDTVTRMIAEPMAAKLGAEDRRPERRGRGRHVGAGQVADADPDGYAVLMHHIGMSTAPALYQNLGYEPLEDFEIVGLVTEVPMTIVARKDFEPATLQDLVDLREGERRQGHPGQRRHRRRLPPVRPAIQTAIGVELQEVPYEGTGPALTDLVGGQVDFMCDQTTNTTAQIQSGEVKAYAVTTPERVKRLPDLPTTAEAGCPDSRSACGTGSTSRPARRDEIVQKLSEALKVALADQKVIDRWPSSAPRPSRPRTHPGGAPGQAPGADRPLDPDHRGVRSHRRMSTDHTPRGRRRAPPGAVPAGPLRGRRVRRAGPRVRHRRLEVRRRLGAADGLGLRPAGARRHPGRARGPHRRDGLPSAATRRSATSSGSRSRGAAVGRSWRRSCSSGSSSPASGSARRCS